MKEKNKDLFKFNIQLFAGPFTVTYNSNGGSTVDSEEVEDGSLATEPSDPTRTGYTFEGWYSDAELTTPWDFDSDTVTANTTLYAKWLSNLASKLRTALTNLDNKSKTTEEIVINADLGVLPAGTTIDEGTTISDLIRLMAVTVYNPTYVSPSLSLDIDVDNEVEAGYQSDAVLTATFNKGQIKGDLVGGLWDADAKQDDRAGDVDYYEIDGTDTGTTNTKSLTSYTFEFGSNEFSAEVFYLEGPQPVDSEGDDFDTPLSAGSLTASKTVYGRRKLFYGVSLPATDSAEVRALTNSSLNPQNGTTFTINIPTGASSVVFAYPAALQDVSSVIYVEGLNAEVKSAFTKTTVSVEGANGYTAVDYKVYIYEPVEDFDEEATYEVTI